MKKSNVLIYNIAAVAIGLIISAAMLLFMQIDPIKVIGEAGRKILTDKYTTGEILVKATPLIFTSLALHSHIRQICSILVPRDSSTRDRSQQFRFHLLWVIRSQPGFF